MDSPNKVFVNRSFSCSVSDLFNWLIRPDLIIQWFGPNQLAVVKVNTDVRVGGKYSIELEKSNDQNFFIVGEYLKIIAPHELTYTSHYEGLPNTPPDSIIKIKIEELSGNESSLSLIQEFESLPADMANRTKAWEHMFLMLANKINVTIE